MANIGDRYVIEIDSKMTNKNGTLYGIKGFKSLVFDEEGLSRLTKVETPFWKLGGIVKDRINGRMGVVYALKESGFNAIWDDGFSMYKKNDDCRGSVGETWRMTSEEAIRLLKIEYNKHRGDFYADTREAYEMAITALYREEVSNESGGIIGTAHRRARYKGIAGRSEDSTLHDSGRPL